MDWPFGLLKPFDYEVIVVDPPWDFENYSDKGTVKGADPHYDLMPLAEIAALPVGHLGRLDALLLLWATAPMLPQALAVMESWGARYKSNLVWRKLTKNGKARRGTGYRAINFHEHVLMGVFGDDHQIHQPIPSLFNGLAREHSRKPDEFYELIRAKTPGLRRCDLFSGGHHHEGFDGWGKPHGKFKVAA